MIRVTLLLLIHILYIYIIFIKNNKKAYIHNLLKFNNNNKYH